MNRHEATIFRGGAIIRTGCALIALSEGPCGKPVGCSTAAANTTGVPPAPIASATPQPKLLPVIFQKMITGSFG